MMVPPSSNQEPAGYDGKFLALCRFFSGAAAILSLLVGSLTLLGWILGIKIFLWTLPGTIVMKANAGLALLLSGVALLVIAGEPERRSLRWLAGSCAFLAGLLGLLTLIEHATGANLGIDQLLAVEPPHALKTASPGRMAPNAALCFTLVGMSLVLLALRRGYRIVSWMTIVSGTIAFLALMGYAYASESLIGFGSYTHIAAQAALALLALSAGTLFCAKESGLMEPLARSDAGSRMARRLMPAVILIPFLLALLRYESYRRGLVPDEFGVAVMVIVGMVVLAVVVWRNAVALNRFDAGRRSQERELRASEERFRTVVEHSPVGVFIVQDGRIVFQNPAQRKLFGAIPEGFEIGNFRDVHPEDAGKFRAFLQAIRPGESPTREVEFRFFPSGKESEGADMRWVHAHIGPIEYNGRAAMVVAMIDITNAKEMEQAALRQEKLAVLGKTTAGIAHEIRNPLSSIIMNLSLVENLLEEAVVTAPEEWEIVRKSLTAARTASGRIEGVIGRVVGFVKPTRPLLGCTEVNTAVGEAVELVAVLLRDSRIRLETALSGGLPPCKADPQLIGQVLLNLITNAAQAMEKRDGEKKIEVSTGREEDAIVIKVADSGPGVAENLRRKIFDPFYTTKELGTGLGLSICYRIVKDHSGTIDVGTSRFGGAEFTVRLPSSPAPSTVPSTY